MFLQKIFSTQNVSRPQAIVNLYTMIVMLAFWMLFLGLDMSSLASDYWHGDPYHGLHHHVFTVCLMFFVIILTAFQIHQYIQRLTKFDSEQKTDPASL